MSLQLEMALGIAVVAGAIGGVIVSWALTHRKYRRMLWELGELRRVNNRAARAARWNGNGQ